jgi:type I restriction enzyme S subunit
MACCIEVTGKEHLPHALKKFLPLSTRQPPRRSGRCASRAFDTSPTAAIKEKVWKLTSYMQAGIVGPLDAYVIAVNGCQLGALPLSNGISGLPYAIEAVFPVGPKALKIDRDTGKRVGQPFVTERFAIINANGANVATTPFVDPAYAGVSAIIGCSLDRSSEPKLPLDVVHNPFARNRIPPGVLGSAVDEWRADAAGTGELELRRAKALLAR